MARPRKNSPKPNTQELSLVPVEEQPYPLPEGWKWVRLLSAFTNHTDSKKKLQQKEYLPSGSFAVVDQGKELVGGYTERRELLYSGPLPAIIFGDHTRCVKFIDFPFVQGADGVKVLHAKDSITHKFFYYALINVDIPHLGYRRHFPLFDQFILPLPPLDEQERIVTRIESLFAKLDEAKEKAEAVLDSYETRKAAILHKAFTGELTAKWREEKGVAFDWKEKTLADIGTIVTGSTPSTKHPEYYGKEVPFIKPTDLNAGRYVVQSTEYLSMEGVKVSRPVKAGSTCVCCIGATISKCGFLLCNAVTNQQINTICPYDFMHGLFVYYWCTSSTFKQTLIENSSATTLPIINKSRMSALPIPVPPLPEQQEITRILDSLLEKEQQSKEAAETVLEQIDLMKKAILAKAFRGEVG